MDELEALGRRLEALSRRQKKLLDALAGVREQLADVIVAAASANMRQNEIVARTGYSRERIRQICRKAGIESAR